MAKTIKAHILPPLVPSLAVSRVMDALEKYAPRRIKIVDSEDDADLVVLNVVGRHRRIHATVDKLVQDGKQYAVVQYVIRSTQKPSTHSWIPLWERASVVWSYYDLEALCEEDGESANFNLYCAPLGVDAKVFRPTPHPERTFVICTSGLDYLAESVREGIAAARHIGKPVLHLGPELNAGPDVTCISGVSDKVLASLYSQCEFVSGLRRKEGFELPAAEGLLCGARPILFDKLHYRLWYYPWATFIAEVSRDQIVDSLEAVFRDGARPITKTEREDAKRLFDWKTIVAGFWKQVS